MALRQPCDAQSTAAPAAWPHVSCLHLFLLLLLLLPLLLLPSATSFLSISTATGEPITGGPPGAYVAVRWPAVGKNDSTGNPSRQLLQAEAPNLSSRWVGIASQLVTVTRHGPTTRPSGTSTMGPASGVVSSLRAAGAARIAPHCIAMQYISSAVAESARVWWCAASALLHIGARRSLHGSSTLLGHRTVVSKSSSGVMRWNSLLQPLRLRWDFPLKYVPVMGSARRLHRHGWRSGRKLLYPYPGLLASGKLQQEGWRLERALLQPAFLAPARKLLQQLGDRTNRNRVTAVLQGSVLVSDSGCVCCSGAVWPECMYCALSCIALSTLHQCCII
jgi:hypothetical protein